MKPIPLILALCSLLAPLSAQRGSTFHDDFESDSFATGGWTVGGRDLAHTGVANVVPRGGSLSGHVYHRSFTETTVSREFEAGQDFALSFDMEVRAVDPGSPGGAFNAFSGANIELLGDGVYGRLEVIYCTSGYRQALLNSDPSIEVLQITPGVMGRFHYTLDDLHALLPGVDPTAVTTVRLTFQSYCSWWNGSANGDVWFDNVSALESAPPIRHRFFQPWGLGVVPAPIVITPILLPLTTRS